MVALIAVASLYGGAVHGTVTVERKLTPRNVTLSAGLYQRGSAVALRADSKENVLDYERSHVVVYLEGAALAALAGSAPAETKQAVMQQQDRRFSPDLVVVPAGSAVSFPNFDPIFHNVFSLSRPKSFDLGNYPQGQTRTVTFAKPGIVAVYCHLHPNMAGTIVVTPNRWSVRVDTAGHFVLADVPPGKYSIVAWHKTGGSFRKAVDVGRDGDAQVDFFVPLPELSESASSSHSGH